MTDDCIAPGEFAGTARLFPLPNLVLFPHVVQGLHVFEPRYRQLMADALADRSLITLVLLKPGWEEDYDSAPAIESVACLGRVTWHEKLPTAGSTCGCAAWLALRILEEMPTDRLVPRRAGRDCAGVRARRTRRSSREAAAGAGRRGPAAFEEEARRDGNSRNCSTARCRSARCATCSATPCRCRWR